MDEISKLILLYFDELKKLDMNSNFNRFRLWDFFCHYLSDCWTGMSFDNGDFELFPVFDTWDCDYPKNVIVISKFGEFSVFGLLDNFK